MRRLLLLSAALWVAGCSADSGLIVTGGTAPLTITLPAGPDSRALDGTSTQSLTSYYEIYIYQRSGTQENGTTIVITGEPGEVITTTVPVGEWQVFVLAGTPDGDGFCMLGNGSAVVTVEFDSTNELTLEIEPVFFNLSFEGLFLNGQGQFFGSVVFNAAHVDIRTEEFSVDSEDVVNVTVQQSSTTRRKNVSFTGTTIGSVRLGATPLYEHFLQDTSLPETRYGRLISRWYLGCASDRVRDALWTALSESFELIDSVPVGITIEWNG